MISKSMSWAHAPSLSPAPSVRRAAARPLRWAGCGLARLARWIAPAERRVAAEPMLEFHAEAGAPEGALYVDGRRIGVLPGVKRL